jgi:hypothetical protein
VPGLEQKMHELMKQTVFNLLKRCLLNSDLGSQVVVIEGYVGNQVSVFKRVREY